MFKIASLLTLVHVAADSTAAEKWYRDVFGAHVFWRGEHSATRSLAIKLVIGDLPIEILTGVESPTGPSGISKFYARYGERLYSLTWNVPDLKDCFDTLHAHGIRLHNAAGQTLTAAPEKKAIFTHPRDTSGGLEFALQSAHVDDRAHDPGPPPAYWRDSHPLGIAGISHLSTLVPDLEQATRLYRDVLGCGLFHSAVHAGEYTSAFFAVGNHAVIEARQPLPDSATASSMATHGVGAFGITFKVRDLGKAVAHLSAHGVKTESPATGMAITRPEHSFGVRFGFADAALPGDARFRSIPA
jgi:catechol 2,3-dioxygenase-like lactoylglutathione lyase family enzyme